jgi:hypothetical protein
MGICAAKPDSDDTAVQGGPPLPPLVQLQFDSFLKHTWDSAASEKLGISLRARSNDNVRPGGVLVSGINPVSCTVH